RRQLRVAVVFREPPGPLADSLAWLIRRVQAIIDQAGSAKPGLVSVHPVLDDLRRDALLFPVQREDGVTDIIETLLHAGALVGAVQPDIGDNRHATGLGIRQVGLKLRVGVVGLPGFYQYKLHTVALHRCDVGVALVMAVVDALDGHWFTPGIAGCLPWRRYT